MITGKEKEAYPLEPWERIVSLAVSPDGKTLAWSGLDTKEGTVRYRSLKPAKSGSAKAVGAKKK